MRNNMWHVVPYYGFDYVNPEKNPPEYQSYGDKGVDFLTDEAINFMKKNVDHPFFIYLSHHSIHNPVLAPDELTEEYLKAGYPEKGLNFASYLASIRHIDNSMGRLSSIIKELDIENNTIVIFISDNGGVDSQFDNSPLRYGKGSAYEGGIRVPFIIKWSETIRGGKVIDIPVHIVDFYPTFLAVAGIRKPPDLVLDGTNLLPLLKGEKKAAMELKKRPLYFYQPLYDIQWGATPSASIIEGDFKLIHFFGDYIDLDSEGKYIPEGRTELFNLVDDIGERNNLSLLKPSLTNKMKIKLFEWIKSCNADIPEANSDFDIAKWSERVNKK